jgi:hypothetical protein
MGSGAARTRHIRQSPSIQLGWAGYVSVLAVFSLAACLPGAVLGEKARCTGSAERITQVIGECERTIEKLGESDTQTIAVQTMDVAPFATVDFAVAVDSGLVAVTFTDHQGHEQTVHASPGQPATGSVRVRLDPLNQIKFDLAPVEGEATGVRYHIRFVCDCLP